MTDVICTLPDLPHDAGALEPHVSGRTMELAIDAWEHAYYLQYEDRKADFFAAFWNIVNWDDVSHRLADARNPRA